MFRQFNISKRKAHRDIYCEEQYRHRGLGFDHQRYASFTVSFDLKADRDTRKCDPESPQFCRTGCLNKEKVLIKTRSVCHLTFTKRHPEVELGYKPKAARAKRKAAV